LQLVTTLLLFKLETLAAVASVYNIDTMKSFGGGEGMKPNTEHLTPEQKQQLEQDKLQQAAIDEIEQLFVEGQNGLVEQVAKVVEENRDKAKAD